MSRIGKLAVAVPAGVKPELKGQALSITGKLGTLKLDVHPEIEPKLDGAKIVLLPRSHSKQANALWGTNRALIGLEAEILIAGQERLPFLRQQPRAGRALGRRFSNGVSSSISAARRTRRSISFLSSPATLSENARFP